MKTLPEAIALLSQTESELRSLQVEIENIESKTIELQSELADLQRERDGLEAEQKDAPRLILASKNAVDEFGKNRAKLAVIYEKIDSLSEMIDVLNKAVDHGFGRKRQQLDLQLQDRRKIALKLYKSDILAELAKNSGDKIRMLAAITSTIDQASVGGNAYHQIGRDVCTAVFGSGIQPESERKNIITSIIADLAGGVA